MDEVGLVIERRVSASEIWFGVRGDFDPASIGTFSTLLWAEIDGQSGDVAIDLSGIGPIDPTGVHLLAAIACRLASEGRHVRICATNPVLDQAPDLATRCEGVLEEHRLPSTALADSQQWATGVGSSGAQPA